MSSYDEHLISMAGGDGDPLDQIQRRVDKVPAKGESTFAGYALPVEATVELWNLRELARTDVPDLLALVRTQQATLAAVLNLANTSGRCGWRISADELRRTLRGES